MAPILNSRPAIVARSDMSPGAIAGTVVGCVLGGGFLFIVLGFLYFRHRRMTREAQADDGLPKPKATFGQNGFASPWQGSYGHQTILQDDGRLLSLKDDKSHPAIPAVLRHDTDQSQSGPGNWASQNETFSPQGPGQDSLPQEIDFSLPRQETHSSTLTGQTSTQPSDQAAANASYYDTRISLDSDPEPAITAPSRQMTDMYKAQLQEAEQHRKRSGSLPRRVWNSFKRKRSTHSSIHGPGGSASSPTSQQYFPASPRLSPIIKAEPTQEMAMADLPHLKSTGNRFYEEPEEMGENSAHPGQHTIQQFTAANGPAKDVQQHKRQEQETGDSQFGDFPLRTDTFVRETTEKDPELPSSALMYSTYDGLPPATQPLTPAQHQARLKSPDIPEPMQEDPKISTTPGQSPPLISGSPSSQDQDFINPMISMYPTNAAEKAAYTTYQMENSASPPTMPLTPPQVFTEQPPSAPNYEPSDVDYDHDMDEFLHIPTDDEELRMSSDSYDFSTTPGQSSTDPSSGRTPDTRITASPSPFHTISEHLKPEPDASTSPESSKLSPHSTTPLMCEDCGRTFDQIHKLNHHKRYHDRKHECTYAGCDKKFGTKTHLDRHINDKHVKSKAYHCTEPTCPYFKGGKAFPRKDNWRRHMIKKHNAQDLDAMDQSFG
ncbi:hypothetical protein F5Y15DRAFT_85277 [Xylariaceae sp. FL0016]|nr:hypothetical protein F5Y15DRAFT_85277 [Xylariaceae sp. FL0016]